MITVGAPRAAESPRRYTYRVHDAIYGAIGTYSYNVSTEGDVRTVTTEARIRVSFLGIVLYSQDASRTERLVGDRIIYFHGITKENGHAIEVDGRAVGSNFEIVSPRGKVVAPGTIRSVSPWSIGAASSDIVFMPDTGVVVKVRTSGGEEISITIDGAPRRVRRYQVDTVDGKERYQVWVDESRTPLTFSIQDKEGTVTFILAK